MLKNNILLVVFTLMVVIMALVFTIMTPFLYVVCPTDAFQNAKGFIQPPKDPYYRFAATIKPSGAKTLISVPGFVDKKTKKPVEYNEENIQVFVDGYKVGFHYISNQTQTPVDIVFAIDSTESMEYTIEGVKNSVAKLVDQLTQKKLDVRIGGIDFGDEARTRIMLSREIKPFKKWLDGLSAAGGGDSPEGAIDATIHASNTMNWRPDSQRVIILLTNSTSHFKGEGKLSYYSGNIKFIFKNPRHNLDDIYNLVSGSAIVHVASRDPVWHWRTYGSNAQGKGGGGEDLGRIGSNSELGLGIDCSLIADYTGGVAMPLYDSEKLDLTSLPIESVMTKWVLLSVFANIADGNSHNIQILITIDKDKSGMASFINYIPPQVQPFSAYLDKDKDYVILGNSIDWLTTGLRIQKGTPMIPLRWFCDQIGADLEQIKSEQRFKITWSNKTISLWPQKEIFYLDIQNANNINTTTTTHNKLKTAPNYYQGSVLVPIDFIQQAFDCVSINYDTKKERLTMTYPK